MKKSADVHVQNFILEVTHLDHTKHQILNEVREIVFTIYPNVKERMMYGGIIFSLSDDWGGVFVYKNHVSFEFSLGYKMEDTHNLLEGKGKFRRHLKIRSINDLTLKNLNFYIKQIKELNN